MAKAVLDNLEARAAAVLNRIEHAATSQDAAALRQKIRPLLRRSLGLDQFPWPPALNPQTTGFLQAEGYSIEKIIYESLPGTHVPVHLYVPESVENPSPAVIFYPGHWMEDSKTRPDFQAFCINMARLGFVVLTFDPFGQGERGVSWRDHRRTSSLLVGISQQGFAAYETQCAIEYLLTRPEVDPNRIGITGASGGGYNSWISSVLDDRISAAVPVVGTSDFLEQIHDCRPLDWYQAKEHCHFVPGLLLYADNHEFLAAVAPRPLLIIAASDDQSFPIAGVRRLYRYGRGLYQSFGKEQNIAFFEDSNSGHGYQKEKREAAYGWFLKWLMGRGDAQPYAEPETVTLPYDSPELRCLPLGRNQAAGPGMVRLVERLAQGLKRQGNEFSLERILGELPSERPPAVGLSGATYQRLEVQSEKDLVVAGFLYTPPDPKGLLVVVDDRGKEAALSDPLVREAEAQGWAICGVDPRGIGELSVKEMGWVSAVSLLLGESFVWRQAWDIRQVIESVRTGGPARAAKVVLYGRGDNAGLALVYVLAQYSDLEHSPVTAYALRDSFLTFRHFIGRPESMQKSFQLMAEGVELDREIPFRYFVFDVLRNFDIPDLLATAGVPGSVIRPVDGDWSPLLPEQAKKVLPAGVTLISETEAKALVSSW